MAGKLTGEMDTYGSAATADDFFDETSDKYTFTVCGENVLRFAYSIAHLTIREHKCTAHSAICNATTDRTTKLTPPERNNAEIVRRATMSMSIIHVNGTYSAHFYI